METSHTTQTRKESLKTKDLGTEITVFPMRNQSLNRWIGFSLGCLLILASIVFSALRFTEIVMSVRVHGRAIILLHAPYLLISLTGLPLGAIILFLRAVNWDNHLTLHDRGLILRQGLTERTWYWASTTRLDTRITHIKFGGGIVNIRIHLTLGNPDETLVIRNRYEDMPTLVQKVRSILLPILAQWAEERFIQNKQIKFHKALLATGEGLEIKGDQISWENIDFPGIKNQQLILNKKPDREKLFQSNLNKITNLDLLIYLIKNPPKINNQSLSR